MSLENINNKAFDIFLNLKKSKIIKSLNIDYKLMGIDKIKDDSENIKIKAYYLWNNMSEDKQIIYINKIKNKLDVSYDFTKLSIVK